MKMNPYLKEELVKELKSISKRMKEEPDPARKLFLYSAANGITNRVMRLEFDSELLLVDTLLNIIYNSVNARLNMFMSGDRIIPVTREILDGLSDCVKDVAVAIDTGNSCYDILQRMMTMSFLTTGPGHYMGTTGQIPTPGS